MDWWIWMLVVWAGTALLCAALLSGVSLDERTHRNDPEDESPDDDSG